ncbi:MAG: hypothetical protein OXH69_15165 [Acidobacteria bacterium]|nr:hypothetical protein [Acidobacteriota bacterium]
MSKARILIADDERLIRWSLVERLSTEGYGTVEAESGSQTLARFDDTVDLVLLDYRLGNGGRATCANSATWSNARCC